ncbi:hypothetical protein [Pseudokineococcus sp. 1T1Z-3]|uniref:hypothetical protein n=1 Tax=Pseudokineococcus sp. 1T1Z-3 TaxID=3132745 RepID=UPI00309DEA4A
MTPENPTSTDRRETADGVPEETAGSSGSDHVMDMLGEHVPLSLLMDLTSPKGPDSETILDDEGLPEDSWWGEAEEPTGANGTTADGDAADQVGD